MPDTDTTNEPHQARRATPRAPIDGHCDPNFRAVKEAFEANFAGGGEVGAAVAVYVDGELVVDLWGGFRDYERTRPWVEDTLVCGFSLSKTLAAACIHVLVDRGLVDWDAPIARYWPEFAAAGKETITVRHVLSHQAGVPGVRRPLAPGDERKWGMVTSALAEQEPWWEPGTRHGYHVGTYGFLVGEVVQRVTGKPFAQFFREEIAGPLALDAHFGLPAEANQRVADFLQIEELAWPPRDIEGPMRAMLDDIYDNPYTLHGVVLGGEPGLADIPANAPDWRASVLPSCNIHLDARSLARFGVVHARGGRNLDGTQFLSREVLDESLVEQARGQDAVLMIPTCFAMGFRRWQPERTIGPNPERSYFAHGFGGALAVVDPDARMAVGYVMNAQGPRSSWLNKRNTTLVEQAYASL